jgi:hypothetical protein
MPEYAWPAQPLNSFRLPDPLLISRPKLTGHAIGTHVAKVYYASETKFAGASRVTLDVRATRQLARR